jgi:hypothetical protein
VERVVLNKITRSLDQPGFQAKCQGRWDQPNALKSAQFAFDAMQNAMQKV